MEKLKKLNLKGHLLTSISYMIPIVCGGGFLVAIGMAMGGTNMYASGLIQGQFTLSLIHISLACKSQNQADAGKKEHQNIGDPDAFERMEKNCG